MVYYESSYKTDRLWWHDGGIGGVHYVPGRDDPVGNLCFACDVHVYLANRDAQLRSFHFMGLVCGNGLYKHPFVPG